MYDVRNGYDFTKLEAILEHYDADHTPAATRVLIKELNNYFYKSKCRDIIYTNNTDKLFFGMRVYPIFDSGDAIRILGDNKIKPFTGYYIEIDSKLYDPMLNLDKKELTAILLHEIGHIVYDQGTIEEVKRNLDLYFQNSNNDITIKSSKGYRELLAYGLKDAIIKIGSLFSTIGYTEIVADSFVISAGYGDYLESAIKKITSSKNYINKSTDNRFIVLTWVLRMNTEFNIKRLPTIKALNKAKELSASELEKREIIYATRLLSNMQDPMNEATVINNIKSTFSSKFENFKRKGIRSITNDIYELNLRIRVAESEVDLMSIIRETNTYIVILQDYLTSENLSKLERENAEKTLNELYDLREKAAKNKYVRKNSDSLINVIYTD